MKRGLWHILTVISNEDFNPDLICKVINDLSDEGLFQDNEDGFATTVGGGG